MPSENNVGSKLQSNRESCILASKSNDLRIGPELENYLSRCEIGNGIGKSLFDYFCKGAESVGRNVS